MVSTSFFCYVFVVILRPHLIFTDFLDRNQKRQSLIYILMCASLYMILHKRQSLVGKLKALPFLAQAVPLCARPTIRKRDYFQSSLWDSGLSTLPADRQRRVLSGCMFLYPAMQQLTCIMKDHFCSR